MNKIFYLVSAYMVLRYYKILVLLFVWRNIYRIWPKCNNVLTAWDDEYNDVEIRVFEVLIGSNPITCEFCNVVNLCGSISPLAISMINPKEAVDISYICNGSFKKKRIGLNETLVGF